MLPKMTGMRRPAAIVVTGPPGAGKSTTGAAIAAALGAALLDLDSLTNPLADLVVRGLIGNGEDQGGEEQGGAEPEGEADGANGGGYDDPRVAATLRSARYACLMGAAADCLRAGTSVVLVAPFTRETRDPRRWDERETALREAGGEPQLVWLQIAPRDLRARLISRGAVRDRGKLADLDRYLAGLDLAAPAAPHRSLDATLTPQAQVSRMLGKP